MPARRVASRIMTHSESVGTTTGATEANAVSTTSLPVPPGASYANRAVDRPVRAPNQGFGRTPLL